MTIYHEKAAPKTQRYLDKVPELKLLASELCCAHGLSVIGHNFPLGHHVHSDSDEEQLHADLRKYLKVTLVDSKTGIPFCVASLGRNSDNDLTYKIKASFIRKERGRGENRSVRESIKLPALMKVFKRDAEHAHGLQRAKIIESLKHGKELISRRNRIQREFDLKRETQMALIEFYKQSKMITDTEAFMDIERFLELQAKANEAARELKEKKDRFKNDLSFILNYDTDHFIAGSIIYCKDTDSYRLHDDVKCYSSIEELASTDLQLMLTYKMYRVNRESKVSFDRILPREDHYSEEFDVITYYNSGSSFITADNDVTTFMFTPKQG